ncbi:neutral zinc metallopeptidase [Nocardiopsis coralliicola]
MVDSVSRFRTAGRALPPQLAPLRLRHRRSRLSTGVVLVMVTGLCSVGLAGFLSVSALFDGGPETRLQPGAELQENAAAPSGEGVLEANPLYSTGELKEVTCPAPELEPGDAESMEAFLHEMSDCLDTAWREHFTGSGMAFEPPNRVFWYASGQSPCGNFPADGSAAFYCQANKGLYLGVEHIVESSGETEHPEAYTFLLSHEYAHHVQGEAGILGYFHAASGATGDPERQGMLSRRSELQANCLGGVFLGSVAGTFPLGAEEEGNILEDAERRGDYDPEERTHGSPENGGMWTAHGLDRGDPAACNTWSAGEDVVG